MRTFVKVLILVVSFLALFALTRSTTPQRSEVQKVFDDFLVTLNSKRVESRETSETSTDALQVEPVENEIATVVMTIKETNASVEFKLRWNDQKGWIDPPTPVVNADDSGSEGRTSQSPKAAKALRVLELLKTANALSLKSAGDDVTFLIIGSSGYKFEAKFSKEQLQATPPLGLAFALMRELP